MNKVLFWIYGFNLEDKISFMFPYSKSIPVFTSLMKIIADPNKDLYDNDDVYLGKGYVECSTVYDSRENPKTTSKFETATINERQMYYLDKFIRLAEDNDSELILVSTPIAPSYLKTIDNYGDITDYFQNYFSEKKLLYYDFNCFDDIGLNDEDFKDYNHLNNSGVNKFDDYILKKNFF